VKLVFFSSAIPEQTFVYLPCCKLFFIAKRNLNFMVISMKIIYCGLAAFLTLGVLAGNPEDRPQEANDDLINDPHFREEHGLNEYNRPSIDHIFEQLAKLAPLPLNEVPFNQNNKMPEEREDLAIEIGFLISEGFFAVQSGEMKKVQDLAAKLSRYSNALGAGEKVKGHAAAILEHSKNNEIDKLKKELTNTQIDVERELVLLQDIDLAHLISLGGWLRALEVSAHAVNKDYTVDRAKVVYREDIADYYHYALSSMSPDLKGKPNIKQILADLDALKKLMLLEENVNPTPTPEGVKKVNEVTKSLVKHALTRAE
jgi:hypothetical protein